MLGLVALAIQIFLIFPFNIRLLFEVLMRLTLNDNQSSLFGEA
jgi:hypothetical protein